MMSSPWASTQARATCPIDTPCFLAIAAMTSMASLTLGKFSAENLNVNCQYVGLHNHIGTRLTEGEYVSRPSRRNHLATSGVVASLSMTFEDGGTDNVHSDR